MARQDDEKRRKELEERLRQKEEQEAAAPAPAQEVEVDSVTDSGAGPEVSVPPATSQEIVQPAPEKEHPVAGASAAEAPEEPPAPAQ